MLLHYCAQGCYTPSFVFVGKNKRIPQKMLTANSKANTILKWFET